MENVFLKNGLVRKIRNFKNYDVTTWLTNNCDAHITQYLKKYLMKFSQLIVVP